MRNSQSIFVGDGGVLVQWNKSVLESVLPLKIRNVSRDQNNTIMAIDGPAALAWKVHVQASTDLSSEDNWTEISPVFQVGDRILSTTLRFPWQAGPRFFRAYVLPE